MSSRDDHAGRGPSAGAEREPVVAKGGEPSDDFRLLAKSPSTSPRLGAPSKTKESSSLASSAEVALIRVVGGDPLLRDGSRRSGGHDASGGVPTRESTTDAAPASIPSTDAPPSGAGLLYVPREMALVLGVSLRTLTRLDATAKLPRAVRVGSAKRWRRAEVEDWIAAGCPSRSAWDARVRSNQGAPRRSPRPSSHAESSDVRHDATASADASGTRGG
jgi:predicted DNA-binding transcriptional regulator AlpA